MISRRDFLQVGMAASAIVGGSGFGNWGRLAAQQTLSQDQLLEFDTYGNVSLIHITDIHGQLKPIYFREPSIRADRPDAILLDGGDTWHGSYTCHKTGAQDMFNVMNTLQPDAMTFHWEFTLGSDRVAELVEQLPFAALGQNIFDAEWDEPAELFPPYKMFERGGTKIAVIGQAFPYMPIANPGWMFPEYAFGIRDENMAAMVAEVRAAGAECVVVLSHNGFDVDKKMASVVPGIDVILSGHTHDALPEAALVGQTIIVPSGSNGKFVSRVDLDIRDGRMMGYRTKLIPIFSDVITPDAETKAVIDAERAPYEAEMSEVIGQTDSLLYRRGNFNGTWDDLICDALISERDAEIALSPGVRWGPSMIPGQDITREDIFGVTSMSYGEAYRTEMTGEDVSKPQGQRITNMTLLNSGEPIDPSRSYVVAGWASVNEDTEGPQIWDVVESGAAVAQETPDPLITELQDWASYTGVGVDEVPYGMPIEFEKHVVRRNVEWLTASPISSINFTPIHALDGTITPQGCAFERHHSGAIELSKTD